MQNINTILKLPPPHIITFLLTLTSFTFSAQSSNPDTPPDVQRPFLEIHSTKGTPHWWYIGVDGGIAFPLKPNRQWNSVHRWSVDDALEIQEGVYEQIAQRLGGDFEIGDFESYLVKNAMSLGVSWQMQLRRHWSFEFGYQHRQHDLIATFPIEVHPSNGMEPFEQEGEITTNVRFDQLNVSMNYIFGTGKVRPYLSAGVAWLKSYEAELQASIAGVSFPLRTYEGGRGIVHPFIIGTGFTWQMKDKWTLDVGADVSLFCANYLTASVGLLYRIGTYRGT